MPDRIDTKLASRTAEMLALPHQVCRRRCCRRNNACSWHRNANGEPCCLINLTAEQRAIFDEAYRAARFAQNFFGTNPEYFKGQAGEQKALDDLGIAIARKSPGRWNRAEWDAAWRERERQARTREER
jgi:hypothetical protein